MLSGLLPGGIKYSLLIWMLPSNSPTALALLCFKTKYFSRYIQINCDFRNRIAFCWFLLFWIDNIIVIRMILTCHTQSQSNVEWSLTGSYRMIVCEHVFNVCYRKRTPMLVYFQYQLCTTKTNVLYFVQKKCKFICKIC